VWFGRRTSAPGKSDALTTVLESVSSTRPSGPRILTVTWQSSSQRLSVRKGIRFHDLDRRSSHIPHLDISRDSYRAHGTRGVDGSAGELGSG